MSKSQLISEARRKARLSAIKARAGRIPILIVGIATLATAVWGGLLRIGVVLPFPQSAGANWVTLHGPMMVCGFLGTVIALERAVGLQKLWTYLPPLLTGAGSAWIVAGGMGKPAPWLILLGSLAYVAVSAKVIRLSRALFTVMMGLGAVTWAVGNGLWAAGWAVNKIVPWWIAFLFLVIVGERLDLARFQKQVKGAKPLLIGLTVVFLLGVVLTLFAQVPGERLFGSGMVAIALWLGRFDIARKSVKQPGLPRFMASCLLSGYVWLAVSGVFIACFSPLESGPRYDAALHAFFVGFVFMMIFGHAPVIFPAVLQLQTTFHHVHYTHVALLHTGLILRVAGDLSGSAQWRQWGAILSSIAMALFLWNTVLMMLSGLQKRPGLEPR